MVTPVPSMSVGAPEEHLGVVQVVCGCALGSGFGGTLV